MNRRFELREQTSQAHTALEATIGQFDSIDDYHRYLVGMCAFRQPIETWLSNLSWPALFGGWRPVMIGGALTADLEDLKLQPQEPHKMNWDIPPDPGSVLGILYVTEGSMLGAQLLIKRAKQLGLTESFGARHLGLQVAKPGGWQEFLAILEAAPDFSVVQATNAANSAFDAARASFQEAAKTPSAFSFKQ